MDVPWVLPCTLRRQIPQDKHLLNLCPEVLLRTRHWSSQICFWELFVQCWLKIAQNSPKERWIFFSCLLLFVFFLLSSPSLDRPVRLPRFFLSPAYLRCKNIFHVKSCHCKELAIFLWAASQEYCLAAYTRSVRYFRISSSSHLSHFWLSA